MIRGIGVDMIETERVSVKLEKNSGFREHVFHQDEITYCESKANKAEHYAARFAAKEALLKALGTGLSGKVVLNEVAVTNDTSGKPSFVFYGNTLTHLHTEGEFVIHLSLSHLRQIACAMVVIETGS